MHGTSCLCTLSASAFIKPSLHQLDFFRNLLWRHVSVLLLIVLHTLQQHCSIIIISPTHAPAGMIIVLLHRQIHAQLKWHPDGSILLRDHWKMLNIDYSFASN